MLMPGNASATLRRQYSLSGADYRYGFNGKEGDDELKGTAKLQLPREKGSNQNDIQKGYIILINIEYRTMNNNSLIIFFITFSFNCCYSQSDKLVNTFLYQSTSLNDSVFLYLYSSGMVVQKKFLEIDSAFFELTGPMVNYNLDTFYINKSGKCIIYLSHRSIYLPKYFGEFDSYLFCPMIDSIEYESFPYANIFFLLPEGEIKHDNEFSSIDTLTLNPVLLYELSNKNNIRLNVYIDEFYALPTKVVIGFDRKADIKSSRVFEKTYLLKEVITHTE